MAKNRQNKKTGNWAKRQNKDVYVKQARHQGARARSFFKLEQVDKKYQLIKPGMNIIDLGSSPGSWSQYAAKKLNNSGHLVAVDLLPMDPIEGVFFFTG